jgi:hypothetical protein
VGADFVVNDQRSTINDQRSAIWRQRSTKQFHPFVGLCPASVPGGVLNFASVVLRTTFSSPPTE